MIHHVEDRGRAEEVDDGREPERAEEPERRQAREKGVLPDPAATRCGGSFSWGGAYGSNYKVDPAEGLVMLFMINQLPNRTDIAPKFSTMVYQSLIAPRAGASVVQR